MSHTAQGQKNHHKIRTGKNFKMVHIPACVEFVGNAHWAGESDPESILGYRRVWQNQAIVNIVILPF